MITYFASKKSPLTRISTKEMDIAKNSIPAEALISLSFKTGMVYPSASSPEFYYFISLSHFYFFAPI
ncbi:MAG: hypothetical protein WDO71_23120 [Bacteroidota bacterium]